ncbi:unnamed protein product, partial [Didymodactylos carnosus]
IYQPQRTHFWELTSDYHLHDPRLVAGYIPPHYTNILGDDIWFSLPYAAEQVLKSKNNCLEIMQLSKDDLLIDGFTQHYQLNEMTVFDELFDWHMDSTTKDVYNLGIQPRGPREFTPFSVRENKQRKTVAGLSVSSDIQQRGLFQQQQTPPSITSPQAQQQQKETSEHTSYSSDGSIFDDTDTDDEKKQQMQQSSQSQLTKKVKSKLKSKFYDDITNNNQIKKVLNNIFPSTYDVYGLQIDEPSQESLRIYEQFSKMGSNETLLSPSFIQRSTSAYSTHSISSSSSFEIIFPTLLERTKLSPQQQNSVTQTTSTLIGNNNRIKQFVEPVVRVESIEIYEKTVSVASNGPIEPSDENRLIYENFVASLIPSQA